MNHVGISSVHSRKRCSTSCAAEIVFAHSAYRAVEPSGSRRTRAPISAAGRSRAAASCAAIRPGIISSSTSWKHSHSPDDCATARFFAKPQPPPAAAPLRPNTARTPAASSRGAQRCSDGHVPSDEPSSYAESRDARRAVGQDRLREQRREAAVDPALAVVDG